MNLVQRIVAENRQSATSQELAYATGMDHLELYNLITGYRAELEEFGPMQKKDDDELVLNVDQLFFAVLILPMSEEDVPTPSDRLRAELKLSIVKIFKTMQKAALDRDN